VPTVAKYPALTQAYFRKWGIYYYQMIESDGALELHPSLGIADVIVAFAPGAQDTMMVLALALHLDPVYVGAHHLARFLAVSFSVAIVARRVVRRLPAQPRQNWKRPGQGTFDD